MIYISLENEWTNIIDKRKIYFSLSQLMPLILEINKVVSLLRKEHKVDCRVSVKVDNIIRMEVINV